MEITEVRVKLVEGGRQEKLKAFCSITIDDAFVIRDLKIIEGAKGLFVAMPSRKLTVRCPKCGSKNQVRSNYCAECGFGMPNDRSTRGRDGRVKLHADIAHPINSECREVIQSRVLENFHEECVAAQSPEYRPVSDEEFDDYALEDDYVAEPVGTGSRLEAADDDDDFDVDGVDGTDSSGRDRRRADRRGRGFGRSREPAEQRAPAEPRPTSERRDPFAIDPHDRFRSSGRPEPKEPARSGGDPPPDDNFDAGIF